MRSCLLMVCFLVCCSKTPISTNSDKALVDAGGSLGAVNSAQPSLIRHESPSIKPETILASSFAKKISPHKTNETQIKIEHDIFEALKADGALLESRFSVQLFDDTGAIKDPFVSIALLNKKLMRERGWSPKMNNLANLNINSYGLSAGMGMYRIWALDAGLEIQECDKARREQQLQLLKTESCQNLADDACASVVDNFDRYLSSKHSTMSMWLGYYIDDYGTVCKPYDVSKKIIEKTKATNKSADAQRRIFLYNYGLNNGMMLVRLSKFTGLAQSK